MRFATPVALCDMAWGGSFKFLNVPDKSDERR